MSEDLIRSVEGLLGSTKSSHSQINDVLSILKLGKQLFPSQKSQPSSELPKDLMTSENKKRLELQRMNKQERILKIIENFTNEFETKSIPNNVSVKNYLTFLLVVFKLSKKLKPGHQRSLVLANTLSRLNKMLVNHPLDFNKRTTREPLGLLFLITESAIEASRNLKFPYLIDETTFAQFLPLMTRFSTDSDDPLQEIVKTISDMPKFRITTKIGEGHRKIFGSVLQHCFPMIPLKTRIETGTRLLKKITSEQNDSTVLSHYNTLKLFAEKDAEIRTILSKLAKAEITKTKYRRFVNGILEELGNQQS
jgi:hypothetical protein